MKETDPSLKVSTLVRYFQPSNAKSVRFLLLVGPISFLVYYSYRVLISWFFRDLNILENIGWVLETLIEDILPYLCTSGLTVIFFCIMAAIVGIELLWLLFPIIRIFRYFRRNHFIAPLVPFFVGMVVAFLIPIPIRPPMTLTESMFHDHRADYEHIVELVRSRQLGELSSYSYDNWGFELPEEFQYLTHSGRATANLDSNAGLRVEFEVDSPLQAFVYVHVLVYIEIPEEADEVYHCGGDEGNVVTQLGEHWFFCSYSWD